MGRWAQRSHRGGGPQTGTGLIQITQAERPDANTVNVTYSAPITAADFNNVDFGSTPTAFTPDSINQNAPAELGINFPDDITAETGIDYTGAVPGVLTPQSVAFT